jgi:hypothetical protein
VEVVSMPVSYARRNRAAAVRRADRGYEIFRLWCELTGREPRTVPIDEVAAFLGRPEVRTLARVPDEVLRDTAGPARRAGVLPLERWLANVKIVRPHV